MVGLLRLLTCLLVLAAPLAADPVRYDLVPSESRVGFIWSFGPDRIRGEMPVSAADVVIDFDRVAASRVGVDIDVSRAEAGFPFADQAMKGPKVLWSDRFPTIAFRSTRVTAHGGARATVEGDLTIRGVTRTVALDATVYRSEGSLPEDLDHLTILLKTRVSRAAFGADGWSDMVGDTVDLEILAAIAARGT